MFHVIAAATPVHTTGINWDSVLTIVLSSVTIITIVVGVISRYLGNRITSSIDKFRMEVVSQLDTRLTRVEVKLENINLEQGSAKAREQRRR